MTHHCYRRVANRKKTGYASTVLTWSQVLRITIGRCGQLLEIKKKDVALEQELERREYAVASGQCKPQRHGRETGLPLCALELGIAEVELLISA